MRTTKKCKLGPVQWKPVNFGLYGSVYEASNTGQIRRIGKQTPLRRTPMAKSGYLYVELFAPGQRPTRYKQSPPKAPLRLYVHRIVALTFVPNPDGKQYVNHVDGHKPNCRADNLEWVTMDENNEHAIATGLNCRGVKHGPYNAGARSPVCKASRQ